MVPKQDLGFGSPSPSSPSSSERGGGGEKERAQILYSFSQFGPVVKATG